MLELTQDNWKQAPDKISLEMIRLIESESLPIVQYKCSDKIPRNTNFIQIPGIESHLWWLW
jgi:hypothetical protein